MTYNCCFSAIMCTGERRTHHVGDIRRWHLATLFGAEKESSAGVHILPFAVSINHRPSSQHFGHACCPSKSQTARFMLSIKMAGTRPSWMLQDKEQTCQTIRILSRIPLLTWNFSNIVTQAHLSLIN